MGATVVRCQMCDKSIMLGDGMGITGFTRSGRSFPGLACRSCRTLFDDDARRARDLDYDVLCCDCTRRLKSSEARLAASGREDAEVGFRLLCPECFQNKPAADDRSRQSEFWTCFFCRTIGQPGAIKTVACRTQGGREFHVRICTLCVAKFNMSQEDLS